MANAHEYHGSVEPSAAVWSGGTLPAGNGTVTNIREAAPNSKVTTRSSIVPRNGQKTRNTTSVRQATTRGAVGSALGRVTAAAAMSNA